MRSHKASYRIALARTPAVRHPPTVRGALLVVVAVAVVAASAACSRTSDSGAGVTVHIATPINPSPAAGTPGGAAGTRATTAPPTVTPVPPPELVLSTTQVYQAGAVLVSVTGAVKDGTATFLGRSYPLIQGTRSMFTFVGVDTDDATGPQTLTVEFTQPTGSKGTLTDTITVLQTQWTVDSLQFDSTTSQLLDPTIVNNEYALLRSIYTTVTPEKYWDGGFILPADGPLTARYGEQRSINGGPPSGHHGGTDIGVDEGTPVKATAAGKVVLARQLQVRGNMVIIDHGGGLYSGYAHLSAFAVSEGQMVQQGEVIGLSGKTGLVTGPHLHWEMAIDGVWLDALRFTDGSNGF